jgi:hypothetical protein
MPGHAAERLYRYSCRDVRLNRYCPSVNEDAPIELIGLSSDDEVILARRSGEPSFVWVQDLGDAYLAAASRGGVDVVVTRQFHEELLAYGVSPAEMQGLRVI